MELENTCALTRSSPSIPSVSNTPTKKSFDTKHTHTFVGINIKYLDDIKDPNVKKAIFDSGRK